MLGGEEGAWAPTGFGVWARVGGLHGELSEPGRGCSGGWCGEVGPRAQGPGRPPAPPPGSGTSSVVEGRRGGEAGGPAVCLLREAPPWQGLGG